MRYLYVIAQIPTLRIGFMTLKIIHTVASRVVLSLLPIFAIFREAHFAVPLEMLTLTSQSRLAVDLGNPVAIGYSAANFLTFQSSHLFSDTSGQMKG